MNIEFASLSDSARPSVAKRMAYGGNPDATALDAGRLYRLERGFPYYRGGSVVFATPQFKALTLYSPTSKTAQVPSANTQSSSIAYPVKTK